MELKFKDYIYITFIAITPFLFLLLSLKFYFSDNFVLNEYVYWFLVAFLLLAFSIFFIITLLYTINHIITEQKKVLSKMIHLILLAVFSIIYIPFYYGIYLSNEKLLGYFMPLVNIGIIILFSFASNHYILNYFENLDNKSVVLSNKFNYLSKDKLFTINVNNNYICNNDLGDYVVACDNNLDDSFLGIYSYDYKSHTLGELDEIYRFHLNQTKDYIKEAGFEYEEKNEDDLLILNYDNMSVLMKKVDYDVDFNGVNDYRLIIIKEVLYNETLIDDFNNLIDSIEFID